jgi:hypothetical protein
MDKHPALFQVNTRVYIKELSDTLKRQATLDDIPDAFLDELAEKGFSWVYLLSVWKTGEAGRKVSRTNEGWLNEFRSNLPDLKEEDICGSGFAIAGYTLDPFFGKPDGLAKLRDRLHKRGMKLMLDFVPNHTAIDHPWVSAHPEYYIEGNEEALAHAPQNFIKVGEKGKEKIFAYGRDPYFDGWPDTLQLNYGDAGLRKAMTAELNNIADVCDGVRCDMAMLVLPEIFQRTWNIQTEPFWSQAIASVRKGHADFTFMAEVYWDMEWELQQQGFDFTYDKRLYDRLRQGDARPVREHFWADFEYQSHSARFLENHDEPRAAGVFPVDQHKAAAMISFFSPGLRFFHQGQFEGLQKKLSVHLNRRGPEEANADLQQFYDLLLNCLKLPVAHCGHWNLLECTPAWDDNPTFDRFIAFNWSDHHKELQLTVIVNYAPHQSQCYVKVPVGAGGGALIEFSDQLKRDIYLREASGVMRRGLYVDLPAWGFHAFVVQPVEREIKAPSQTPPPREKSLSAKK